MIPKGQKQIPQAYDEGSIPFTRSRPINVRTGHMGNETYRRPLHEQLIAREN